MFFVEIIFFFGVFTIKTKIKLLRYGRNKIEYIIFLSSNALHTTDPIKDVSTCL